MAAFSQPQTADQVMAYAKQLEPSQFSSPLAPSPNLKAAVTIIPASDDGPTEAFLLKNTTQGYILKVMCYQTVGCGNLAYGDTIGYVNYNMRVPIQFSDIRTTLGNSP